MFHGGSMEMWKHYFGPEARIIGVDVDPQTRAFADEQVEIVIGDQGDRTFLRELRDRVGDVDIFIDDGGHKMHQQIATFEEMWPAVADDGVYLIEDLHTSYWPEYGGGGQDPTFIEFAKSLIDSINAWHARELHAEDAYTHSIKCMHVYESVIVFDKGVVAPPTDRITGHPQFELNEITQAVYEQSLEDSPG